MDKKLKIITYGCQMNVADSERMSARLRSIGYAPTDALDDADLILINTVCPMLFAYGEAHRDDEAQERAVQLLEQLQPEKNYIVRQWQQCGISVTSAAESQALIQLKRIYCDRKDCLRCRFGYAYLTSAK